MLRDPDTTVTWMRRIAFAAVLLAFGVVVLGAYVRLTTAGLGCPDWPGCYGHVTPTGAAAGIAAGTTDQGATPLDVGKAWREMIHRYFAASLVVLTLILAVLAFTQKAHPFDGGRERTARIGGGGHHFHPGAARHADGDLAGRSADRDTASAVRHDDAGTALVAVADAGCAPAAHRRTLAGTQSAGRLGPLQHHQSQARAHRVDRAGRADRPGGLDQHQLCGHRLSGFSRPARPHGGRAWISARPSCFGTPRP